MVFRPASRHEDDSAPVDILGSLDEGAAVLACSPCKIESVTGGYFKTTKIDQLEVVRKYEPLRRPLVSAWRRASYSNGRCLRLIVVALSPELLTTT